MLRSLPAHESARQIDSRSRPPSPSSTTYGASQRTTPMHSRPDKRPPTRETPNEQSWSDATSRRDEDSSVHRGSRSDERSPTPTRGTYHSRFASYSWSRYRPNANEPNSPPLLFVEYRDYPISSIINAEPSKPLSLSTVCGHQRGAGLPKYTSLSTVTASSSSTRERTMPYPRPTPVRQSSADSVTVYSESSVERASPPRDRELQSNFRKLEINGQNPRVRRKLAGSPSWANSSESESSCGPSPGGPGSVKRTRLIPAESETDSWTKYAKALDGGGSSGQFACTWVETVDNLLERPCGYISKKHLVKRHIESKHLHIKPITCEVCGKGFSQRTNYATHMNTHTGAAPHKCPFEGCNATFGDPARRHRHMKTVHNHQPSKRRTQSDYGHTASATYMEISEPEEEDSS